MSSNIHFPNAEMINQNLNQHKMLTISYLKNKGISQALATISAERFANCEMSQAMFKHNITLLINDLQTGKDTFTGKSIKKIDLDPMMWPTLSFSLEQALIDCAKHNKSRHQSWI